MDAMSYIFYMPNTFASAKTQDAPANEQLCREKRHRLLSLFPSTTFAMSVSYMSVSLPWQHPRPR